MKKKIYVIPANKYVELKAQHHLLEGSMPYGKTTTATSGNLSREDEDLWDE